jgi:hypothetical protein
MRRRDDSARRPLAEDVPLVIEVFDTALSVDRGKKAKLYDQVGPIENLAPVSILRAAPPDLVEPCPLS